jgi:hypothetical protein
MHNPDAGTPYGRQAKYDTQYQALADIIPHQET